MTDYLGPERSEDHSDALAVSWRVAFGVDNDKRPDIIWCVETGLPRLFPQFALLPRADGDLPDDFALADYDPPRIEIRSSVYSAAKAHHPRARFILAHELGHVVSHDRAYRKFLKDGVQERKRIKRMSLESQADEFALHFLLPEHVIGKMTSIGQVMFQCDVTYSLAVRAGLLCGIRPKRPLLPYEMIDIQREEVEDFSEFTGRPRKSPLSV